MGLSNLITTALPRRGADKLPYAMIAGTGQVPPMVLLPAGQEMFTAQLTVWVTLRPAQARRDPQRAGCVVELAGSHRWQGKLVPKLIQLKEPLELSGPSVPGCCTIHDGGAIEECRRIREGACLVHEGLR